MFKREVHHLLIFFIGSFCFLEVAAQQKQLYPFGLSQTFNQQSLVNSAISSDTNFFEVNFSNRTLLGVFNGVSQNYLSAYLSSTGNGKNTRQNFGLIAVNKNEGDYIKRNRLYLRYGIQLGISKKSNMSLGTSLGFINYVYESSVANGGSSAYAKDLNIGAVYSLPYFNVGFSINQLFYPELRPLNEVVKLTRYYNVSSYYKLVVDSYLSFNSYALASFYTTGLLTMKYSLISEIQKQFQVGVGYNFNQGIDVYLGIKKVTVSASNFDFMVSFLAYNTRKLSSTTDQSVEFSIRYFIE